MCWATHVWLLQRSGKTPDEFLHRNEIPLLRVGNRLMDFPLVWAAPRNGEERNQKPPHFLRDFHFFRRPRPLSANRKRNAIRRELSAAFMQRDCGGARDNLCLGATSNVDRIAGVVDVRDERWRRTSGRCAAGSKLCVAHGHPTSFLSTAVSFMHGAFAFIVNSRNTCQCAGDTAEMLTVAESGLRICRRP